MLKRSECKCVCHTSPVRTMHTQACCVPDKLVDGLSQRPMSTLGEPPTTDGSGDTASADWDDWAQAEPEGD